MASLYQPNMSTPEHQSTEYMKALLQKAAGEAGADRLAPIFNYVLKHFAEQDAAAVQKQNSFYFAATLIYVSSALAVSSAIVHYLYFSSFKFFAYFEIACMLGALGMIFMTRRYQLQKEWLECRHLAERLRAGIFMLMIPKCPPIYPDPALSQQHYPKLNLVVLQKAEAILGHTELEACRCSDIESLRRILETWIADQLKFHEKTAKDKECADSTSKVVLVALFGATIIAVSGHIVFKWEEASVLFSIALPAWAAAIHGINELKDNERIAQRSHTMATILEGIELRLKTATTMDELSRIAAEVEWVFRKSRMVCIRKLPKIAHPARLNQN